MRWRSPATWAPTASSCSTAWRRVWSWREPSAPTTRSHSSGGTARGSRSSGWSRTSSRWRRSATRSRKPTGCSAVATACDFPAPRCRWPSETETLMTRRSVLAVTILVLASVGRAGAQSTPAILLKHPELVIVNAKVVTVDDSFSIHQAIAVRDGRVLAIGTTDDIRALAGPSTRVVDAGGRTVLPGLIDSHVHLLRAGFRWKWEVRVDEAQSLDDIFRAVEARTRVVPAGTWILVLGGWHWSMVKERRMPTREELDRIAPHHPVHVQALYDVAQMNTAGIKASGITAVTPNPQGGVLEKDGHGNFTGVVRGFAGMRFAETRFPAPTLEGKIEGLRPALRDLN